MAIMTCPWHNRNSDCACCHQPSSNTAQEEIIDHPQGCDSTDLSSESFSCFSHVPSASTFTSDNSQDVSGSSSGNSPASVSVGSVFDFDEYEESCFSSSSSSESTLVDSDPTIANIYRLIHEQLASRSLTHKQHDSAPYSPSSSSSSESGGCPLELENQDSPLAPSSPSSSSSESGGCPLEFHTQDPPFALSSPFPSSPSSSSS